MVVEAGNENAPAKPLALGIKDGRLYSPDGPCRFVKAHAFGGDMAPRYVCLHDTAGALRPFSSVEWFASKECGTSAHFVVERDGTITQMVPTNKKAFHAGVSSWKGVVGLNSCSVGIEIVNPGKLDNKGVADFGTKVAEPNEIVKMSSPAHGSGYWLPYTREQIDAVIAICRAVVEEYPDCNEIVTHYLISPKRKIDVGPHFPLEEVRTAVFDPSPSAVPDTTPAALLAPAPKAPTVVGEAAKSWSVRYILTMLGAWISNIFFGITDWIGHALDWIVTVAKDTAAETGNALMPLASLAGTLKLNLGNIAIWLGVIFLVIVLARHVKDKVELAKLKQQLPGDTRK